MSNKPIIKHPPHVGSTSEREFLEGPHSRLREFSFVLRVMREFIRGFRLLHFVGPCTTVFGSARFAEDHPYYRMGMEVGARLAEMGFTVLTGKQPIGAQRKLAARASDSTLNSRLSSTPIHGSMR